MHEMSITLCMLDIVKEQMKKNGSKRLKGLKIRVGELTAVEPGSLKFCFEVCTKDTPMEGAALEVEEVPFTGTCVNCKKTFRMEGYFSICPGCGGFSVKAVSGMELDIVSMDVT